MVTVLPSTIIGSALNILNNTSIVSDPLSTSRVGSFFFGPDQELSMMRFTPKGHVIEAKHTPADQHSFGRVFRRDKIISIDINFYVKRGESGTGSYSTLKNRDLVHTYLNIIENALLTHSGSFGDAKLIGFGDIDRPVYESNGGYYIGTISPIFKARVT